MGLELLWEQERNSYLLQRLECLNQAAHCQMRPNRLLCCRPKHIHHAIQIPCCCKVKVAGPNLLHAAQKLDFRSSHSGPENGKYEMD
jgi:hypothetical protein